MCTYYLESEKRGFPGSQTPSLISGFVGEVMIALATDQRFEHHPPGASMPRTLRSCTSTHVHFAWMQATSTVRKNSEPTQTGEVPKKPGIDNPLGRGRVDCRIKVAKTNSALSVKFRLFEGNWSGLAGK